MESITTVIGEAYNLAIGNGGIVFSGFYAAVLCLLLKKEKYHKIDSLKILAILGIIILVIALSPIGIYLYMKVNMVSIERMDEYANVYIFLPVSLCIASALTIFMDTAKTDIKRLGYFIGVCIIISFAGRYIYSYDHYINVKNQQCIVDEDIVEVCEEIISNSGENLEPKVAATSDVINYIRKYDGKIKVLNSYDMVKYVVDEQSAYENTLADEFFACLDMTNFNITRAIQIATETKCQYLCLKKEEISLSGVRDIIGEYGYVSVYDNEKYELFVVSSAK